MRDEEEDLGSVDVASNAFTVIGIQDSVDEIGKLCAAVLFESAMGFTICIYLLMRYNKIKMQRANIISFKTAGSTHFRCFNIIINRTSFYIEYYDAVMVAYIY